MATPGGEISTKLNAASAGIVEAPGADGGDQDKSTPMGGNASTAKKTTSSTKKKTSTVNRKKKDGSTTGISGTPTNARIPQTMLSAASASAIKAEKQLHEQRANAEARKNDAAWLKPDLVNRVLEERQRGKTGPVGFLSQEAQIVDRALAANGLTRKNLTPQAYGCLLEYGRKYACELVADAQDFAWHAGKSEVEALDMELAHDMREDSGPISASLPPRNEVMAIAEEINRIPLPPIPRYCYGGIVLPPQEHQLTARTFDIVSSAANATKRTLIPAEVEEVPKTDTNGGIEPYASYGANKSKRIPVNLKSKEKDKEITANNMETYDVDSSAVTKAEEVLDLEINDAAQMDLDVPDAELVI